jgi:NAD(P)-dependent dehydrogenase (short-subunit alcohol dehydrogenase family)
MVETDMTKPYLDSESARQIAAAEHPLGRIGTVDDVTKAILYFASDDSSWTTGAILALDGGLSAK